MTMGGMTNVIYFGEQFEYVDGDDGQASPVLTLQTDQGRVK